MMRNTLRSHQQTEKVSVKMLSSARPTISKHANNPIEQNYWQSPPNHIESETSVSIDPFYPQQQFDRSQTRQRRRKIFEKKILKATVIPFVSKQKSQKSMDRKQNQNHLQNFYQSPSKGYSDGNESNENYYTVRSMKNESVSMRQNSQTFQTIGKAQLNQTLERQQRSSKGNYKNEEKEKHPKPHNVHLKKLVIQKSPSFAQSNTNSELLSNERTREFQLLPEEVRKIKEEVLSQKKQISYLNDKINLEAQSNFVNERKLLDNLIRKQNQLTQKQEELNESLQKINRIQIENGLRYDKILKNELELERNKRLQKISRQNQRLYQELMKSQSRETEDVTPLSHPVNIKNYFRQGYAEREISTLYSPFKEEEDNYDDRDNTLKDLLSPLQIEPDYQI